MEPKEALNKMVDKVLAYRPKKSSVNKKRTGKKKKAIRK
jgi:hypothetical protein